MISRKLYLSIIFYVSLIVLFSILLGYLVMRQGVIRYIILCGAGIITLAVMLVIYLNRTNRNIRLFFDSVRNDDSNFRFPVHDRSTGLKELNESMNRLNRQIQQLKIENSQQEQYFRIILEHLGTGIITYDRKGFIHHTNSAARRLLSLDILTHLQQLSRVDDRLLPVINSIKPFERRVLGIQSGNAEIQLSIKSTSFGSGENELVILSVQDIKNELDEKELDSWMKLIRVLMHEIMNSITPITSISDSLSALYKQGDNVISPEEIDQDKIMTTVRGLKVISEQGNGLSKFVESYRRLTRIPRPELKLLKIADLFDRVRILSGSFDQKAIIFVLPDPGLVVFADENLISLVLINLIKNAVEANETNDKPCIKITAGKNKDAFTEICVSDDGPGIATENLDKIFIPFFTTRPEGSGIGLSLSRQIMSAHGGTLRVISIPWKETVFCLTFRN
ncbi:MAG TPA: ATP-binding protein [Bacteroidales bacterium]|nr:ATP-binding protein [Bacteroidales bacterium]